MGALAPAVGLRFPVCYSASCANALLPDAMSSPTPRWRSTFLPAAVCLLVGLGGGVALTGQEPGAGLSETDRAADALRDARSELEKIAGDRWLAAEAPPLPGPLGLGLTPDEQTFDLRLSHEAPETWSARERRRLQAVLDRHGAALAGLAARGTRVEPGGFPARVLELLRAATLQSLRDRLALLHGEETACLAGLEVRSGLAERLYPQDVILGPLLANALQLQVLEDVHRLAERSATNLETLEHLEGLVLEWQLELPDAAAVAARQGLQILEPKEPPDPERELGAKDPARFLFDAQIARDFVTLAHACRETACEAAAAIFAKRRAAREPSRIPADFLMPNILHGIRRIDAVSRITGAARIALGLRIEAPDLGGYPADPQRLSAPLQAALADLAGLAYEPHGHKGAHLELGLEGAADLASGPAGDRIPPLLAWDLPPVPSPEIDR